MSSVFRGLSPDGENVTPMGNDIYLNLEESRPYMSPRILLQVPEQRHRPLLYNLAVSDPVVTLVLR